MTNVKIQMTNQIQMIKCLNDSVKKPDQRPGLLCCPQGRPDSFFLERCFPNGKQFSAGKPKSRFNLGTPRSKPFAHSALCFPEGIPIINVKPITFLDFGL